MYGVIRLEKYKRSAVYGIQLERNRTKSDERNFAYSDIDRDRTEFNYIYKHTDDFNKEINRQIKEAGVKARPDSIVMMGAVITASAEFFTQNPAYLERSEGKDTRSTLQKQKWIQDEKTMEFFDESLQLLIDEKCAGDPGRIISAKIDFDEQTPHLQVYFVPLVERSNKKGEMKMHLSAKDIMGNRSDLRRFQDMFYEKIGKPRKFERGELVDWDKSIEERKKHTDTINYKKEQNKLIEAENRSLKAENREYEQKVRVIKEQAQKGSEKVTQLYGLLERVQNQYKEKSMELDKIDMELDVARAEINELERQRYEMETMIRNQEKLVKESKDRGAKEVQRMEKELEAMRSEYARFSSNIQVVRDLNEKIEKASKNSKTIFPKEYGQNPAQKDWKGNVKKPATTEVDTADYERLKDQKMIMPSDSWAIGRVERELKDIQQKLDGSGFKELRDKLREAEEKVRSMRQERNRSDRLYNSMRVEIGSLMRQLENDPSIPYNTAVRVNNKLQDVLDDVSIHENKIYEHYHEQ